MSDLDFELNIDKYTPKELKALFSLSKQFTNTDINEQRDIFKQKVLADTNLDEDKKQKIINFLNNVDNKLNKVLLDDQNRIKQNVITQYGSQFIIDRNANQEKDPNGVPPSVKINPYRTGPGDAVSMLSGWEHGTTTSVISVDSKFREQYFKTTSTDFLVTLPINITNVVSMKLVALEIPATYFVISKRLGNNYFHIFNDYRFSQGGDNKLYKISLPDGNYSREQMQDMLNLMFKAANFRSTWHGHEWGGTQYTPEASIDKKSGRVIIDLKLRRHLYFGIAAKWAENGPITLGPGSLAAYFTEYPLQMKLGWILGFRVNVYISYVGDVYQSNTYVSEGIYDGWGSRYFYFVVDDFNKNSVNGIDAVCNSSVISDNILARVTRSSIGTALNVGFTLDSALLKTNDATKQRIYFGPVNIKKLRIKVLDAYGRVIDLNNMDISFALRFDRLYD